MTTNKAYAVITGVTTEPPAPLLADSFSGSAVDTTKWTVATAGNSANSVTESGGSLNCYAASTSVSSGSWAGVYSNSAYDLTGQYASVDLYSAGQAPNAGTTAQCLLYLMASQTTPQGVTGIEYVLTEGNLQRGFWNSGSISYVGPYTDPWNSSSQRYLRVRESGGTIYFEYSADGSSWTLDQSAATPSYINPTSLYASVWGGNWTSGGSSTTAGFAAFALGALTPLAPALTVVAEVVSSADAVLSSPGSGLPSQISVPFNYGDSEEKIRRSVVSAVQSAAGDSTLDVEIVG